MIPPSVVAEIECLVGRGKWSFRQIARMTGVSRGSVAAIARGKPGPGDELAGDARLFQRCPQCGGLVRLPCVACTLHKLAAVAKRLRSSSDAEDPLQIELRGEPRARYEAIRARREAEERGRAESADRTHGESRPLWKRSLQRCFRFGPVRIRRQQSA